MAKPMQWCNYILQVSWWVGFIWLHDFQLAMQLLYQRSIRSSWVACYWGTSFAYIATQ
jgi:hypothetical protein